jgi:hypothetical protein
MAPSPALAAVGPLACGESSARRLRWHAVGLLGLTASVEPDQVFAPCQVAGTLAVQLGRDSAGGPWHPKPMVGLPDQGWIGHLKSFSATRVMVTSPAASAASTASAEVSRYGSTFHVTAKNLQSPPW